MAIDPDQLDSLVRAAAAGTPDADLAAALSTPVKTPKVGRVTYTSLAAVWGTTAAATFAAKIDAAIAAGAAFGPVASFVDKVLSGPGIDPSNAEVPSQSALFVAAGLATQEQVDGVFFDVTYPAGDVVSTAAVAASRAHIARVAGYQAAMSLVINQYNVILGRLSTDAAGTASPPDEAATLAMLGAKQ